MPIVKDIASSNNTGGPPLKLLSLDGGGVRGISSLEILNVIEKALIALTGKEDIKPCDYFDMIAGTSTGGLIAIMLGRLKMSIKECIAAYDDLASTIFDPINTIEDGYYDPAVLEKAVKGIISAHLQDENAPMTSPPGDKCKVFVVACQSKNVSNRLPTQIRTYLSKDTADSSTGWTIWEAARATSAAPTYFQSIQFNNIEYVDGGMSFNNPVSLLYSEAELVFGRSRPIGCLLSVGTGMYPDVEMDSKASVLDYLTAVMGCINILGNSEMTHLEFQNLRLLPDDAYYRFNYGKKNPDGSWADPIAMDDCSGMPLLKDETKQYMKSEAGRVAQCARKLAGLN